MPPRDARTSSCPGAPKGAPALAGPGDSPGAGAAAALLEQRLPKERRFLESKGLGARAVCEPCREAEVICWETLCVSPEPPFFQGPAQRLVSLWTNSSVGQAELASTEQAGRGLPGAGSCGMASMLGASRQQLRARARVTCPLCPQPGIGLFPTQVGAAGGERVVAVSPSPGNGQLSCFLLICSFSWLLSLSDR